MRVCSEVVPFEELRFLAVTDELIAEAWRNRPATLVKKSYARFDSFERLATLPCGLAQAAHRYGEGFSNLGGELTWSGLTVSAAAAQLAKLNLDDWLYVHLIVRGGPMNWFSAVRFESLSATENGATICFRTIYRKLIDGFWQVSLEPIGEDQE